MSAHGGSRNSKRRQEGLELAIFLNALREMLGLEKIRVRIKEKGAVRDEREPRRFRTWPENSSTGQTRVRGSGW